MSNNANNSVTDRWERAFTLKLDTNPQEIHRLITSEPDREFFRLWHNYGRTAGEPERRWAVQYGNHPGMKAQGTMAMEFLRRGLNGQSWEDAYRDIACAVTGRKQPNGHWMKFGSPLPFAPTPTPPGAT